MALTSTIIPYDTRWPDLYQLEASRLTNVLGDALIAIHHVGSTAVPGLSAKPEIDLLAVVENLTQVDDWTKALTKTQYQRGRDLSEGHLFYKRDVEGVRTHKIHVCLVAHPKIGEMLKFRDYLREHEGVREEYQALKIGLERHNTEGIGQYLKGKEPFIRAVLEGFEASTRLSNFDHEWTVDAASWGVIHVGSSLRYVRAHTSGSCSQCRPVLRLCQRYPMH